VFKPPSQAAVAKAFPKLANITSISNGGFKAVFSSTAGNKKEALKLIYILPVVNPSKDDEVLAQKESKARVRRELELLGKIKCPEIVKLGSLKPVEVQIEGQDFIAYTEEFLDGKNLWDIIKAGGAKPTEEELRALFTALITAIDELWGQHKTVHRDIKPMNVMKRFNAKKPFVLIDLGIAFVVDETALTNAGFPCTHRYMAPEMIQVNFRDNLDFRSDLYTTALTIYEYAAQRHPIAGSLEDKMVTITRAVREIPAPLKDYRSDLSADFCETIDQMLKKKPALRPSNLKILLAKAGARP
jgi:serine/threonine protein kinase